MEKNLGNSEETQDVPSVIDIERPIKKNFLLNFLFKNATRYAFIFLALKLSVIPFLYKNSFGENMFMSFIAIFFLYPILTGTAEKFAEKQININVFVIAAEILGPLILLGLGGLIYFFAPEFARQDIPGISKKETFSLIALFTVSIWQFFMIYSNKEIASSEITHTQSSMEDDHRRRNDFYNNPGRNYILVQTPQYSRDEQLRNLHNRH